MIFFYPVLALLPIPLPLNRNSSLSNENNHPEISNVIVRPVKCKMLKLLCIH